MLFPLSPFLNSCKDDPGNLTPALLPKSDIISAYQTDTTSVVTSMYLKDSALTNNAITCLLGSYNDPIFGQSKASIYAEVFPSTYGLVPWAQGAGANGVHLDSVLLLLQLDPATPYGSLDQQTFEVYRTTANIDTGVAYYSSDYIPYNPTPIGTAQITPPNSAATPNDTLRIPLNKNWWLPFSVNVQSGQQWETNFRNLMKGLYITTSNTLQLPGQGSILYLNLYSSFSGIYFYYHYTGPTRDADSSYYVLLPVGGLSGQFFSTFNHNYATTALNATHPSGPRDSVNAGQLVYIQSMGGVVGRLNFPNLYKNWSKLGPVIVNEAEVTLPINLQDQTPSFGPPTQLYLVGTNSNWQGYTIPDEAQPYYGGTSNGTSYTFVITQYIQSIINGKNDSDRGLYIIPANTSTTANSVVLYGAQHGQLPANKTSLTIYYTPVKKP